MSIKTILVVVSRVSGDEARLDAAIALADLHDAQLAALHVVPNPVVYAGAPGMEVPAAMFETQMAEYAEVARQVKEKVAAAATRAGRDIEWRQEEGDELTAAGIEGRYADLLVASPDLARDLVFTAGVPVLAIPDGAKVDGLSRVLVAWNGSREAARAARDAAPFLDKAEAVTVLTVDPPGDRPIGQDVARVLARHGVKVEVRERLSGNAAIGGLILEEAKAVGAGLLVMGAYGHSRFREWVLGGATEGALSDSKIPVLLSH